MLFPVSAAAAISLFDRLRRPHHLLFYVEKINLIGIRKKVKSEFHAVWREGSRLCNPGKIRLCAGFPGASSY
jgi:hypothetical protein